MNENQMKVIVDSLVEASKLGTVNALTYIQKGLEAFKTLEIPLGDNTLTMPYLHSGVREFVDFMLVYLNEAIKGFDKEDRGE